MKTFWKNLEEMLVALDQFFNVFICLLTWRTGYSDETLSAHCWRSYRDGKIWGRIFMPPIDFMFSWQKDDSYTDEGKVVTGHCHRAYLKEKNRNYLPAEYRK